MDSGLVLNQITSIFKMGLEKEQFPSNEESGEVNSTVLKQPIPEKNSLPPSLSIRIRDKIRLFETILPAEDLSDTEVRNHLARWSVQLRYNRILLIFNDSMTNARDRYRYLTEVFFDIQLPSHPEEMQFCFIYDRVGAETDVSKDDEKICKLIEAVLNKGHDSDFTQLNRRVRLNNFTNLSEPEFHYVIDRYHKKAQKTVCRSIEVHTKKIIQDRLVFQGMHEVANCYPDQCDLVKGNWRVELVSLDGHWRVVDIQVEGVEF
ncbi:MAG: hypothetical protein CK547_04990 [Chitinophagaceae bacterium]|nr:MAG: hypothetical protein CK547_04990 [Chitinophagaceae bacterium]